MAHGLHHSRLRQVGGSLYPALLRREKRGHLRAQWRAGEGGPGRKYYALTAAGRGALARESAAWHGFAGNVSRALRTTVVRP
jgi:PadR family transcriptional regulator PadR